MKSLFDNAPAIIEKAAKTPRGILALMIILLGVIAYAFFSNSSEIIKFIVFMVLFAGVSMYTIIILRITKEEKLKSQFTWNEAPIPQEEKITEKEQVIISGQDYFQKESKSTHNNAIPDNEPCGISDTIEMPIQGALKDISVGWRIKHTYAGDIVIKLISPLGKVITLFDREGGARSLGYKMESHTVLNTPSLKAMIGEQILGNWTLNVSDVSARDIGEFVEWGIKIAY